MTNIIDTASSKVPSWLTLFVTGLAQKGLTMAFTALGGYGITLAPDLQTRIATIAIAAVGGAVSLGWTWLDTKIHAARVDKALSAPAQSPMVAQAVGAMTPAVAK